MVVWQDFAAGELMRRWWRIFGWCWSRGAGSVSIGGNVSDGGVRTRRVDDQSYDGLIIQ